MALSSIVRWKHGGIVATNQSRGYVSYRASGLPAGPFGETYVIASAAVGTNGTHWFEFFILSKRHKPHLYRGGFEFTAGDVPEELLKIDEDYLLSEARQQAQNYLDDALFQLAEKHGDHVLARYSVELIEIKNMPLLSLWIRGELHEEIQKVAKETRNPRLKLSLNLVMQNSRMKPGNAV